MSFSVGIVGLPNVGKSTLFKALTRKQVDIADYPFTTIEPNVGVVSVPDKRLEKIAERVKPEKTTETVIKFVDIAGLVERAHKGEGLGNQFLAQIRECDAIVMVLKNFSQGNPEKEAETIKTELLMKDLETVSKALQKEEKDILKRVKGELEKGKEIINTDIDREEIKEYQFLTSKPKVYLYNIKEESNGEKLSLNLKIEEEASELSKEEKKELKIESQLDRLIVKCYNALELITFFTITGGKEAKAWTLKKGSDILEAAERVHSDFKENFIKGEVLPWQKLAERGSWAKAREAGEIKTAGREYIVSDGDVIEFKI